MIHQLITMLMSVLGIDTGGAEAAGMGAADFRTAAELKEILQTPAVLYCVMLLGSFANGLKQLRDARLNGGNSSLSSYMAHLPETLATVVTNTLAFALLIVTEQLNFAAALGIGYVANSASDLLRSGGRSASLQSTSTSTQSPQQPPKQP